MKTHRVIAALLGLASSSCSLVFGLDSEQCSVDADCQSRGGEFADSVCVAGYCRSPTQALGCKSNSECNGTELCLDAHCIKVTNADCPLVLGEENLRSENPILFSIFAPIDELDPDNTVDIKNYRMAIDEFAAELPGGPAGTHPFAGLVCNSRRTTTAMPHVVEKVHVPAILAGLATDDLAKSFQNVGKKGGVFFLSPYDADSTLTAIQDDSLIWNILGSSVHLASVYDPLMQRIASHLNAAEPLRVALVEGAETFELDLAEAVSASMKIDGVVANANPNFVRYGVSPTDATLAVQAVQQLLTVHRPHVILSAAGDEFLASVVPSLEQGWKAVNGTLPFPFYVLSMENRLSEKTEELVQASLNDLGGRLLGVNYAAAEDPSVKQAYLQRFAKKYPSDKNFADFENHYDAMYFLLYSFVGAGNVATYSGADVARGMNRLLSGPRIDVGPLGIGSGTAALQIPNTKISLYGALGPPDFDAGTGSRISQGSVWCLEWKGAAALPVMHDDVLRLDATKKTLEGDFPCFAF